MVSSWVRRSYSSKHCAEIKFRHFRRGFCTPRVRNRADDARYRLVTQGLFVLHLARNFFSMAVSWSGGEELFPQLGFVNLGFVNLGFVNLGFVNLGFVNLGFVNHRELLSTIAPVFKDLSANEGQTMVP
jgi:hypothetical protein